MTVAAENVIDSPTRVTDSISAVRAAGRGPAKSETRDRNRPCSGAPAMPVTSWPAARSSSRTRKTRNSP